MVSERKIDYSEIQATTINKSLSIMNPINAEVNVKRVAIYLALNYFLLLLCLQVLLAMTLARSYSFNSLSSIIVQIDESSFISTKSSTLESLRRDLFIYVQGRRSRRLRGRRGHSEAQQLSLLHYKHRCSLQRRAISFLLTHFACLPANSLFQRQTALLIFVGSQSIILGDKRQRDELQRSRVLVRVYIPFQPSCQRVYY